MNSNNKSTQGLAGAQKDTGGNTDNTREVGQGRNKTTGADRKHYYKIRDRELGQNQERKQKPYTTERLGEYRTAYGITVHFVVGRPKHKDKVQGLDI